MKKSKRTKTAKIIYLISTCGIAIGTVFAIPKLAEYIEKLYDFKAAKTPNLDDDWEPEIVKTSELTKEKTNE